jgi:hypothetical protein
MEISLNSLDAHGYRNQPVPNTYITHASPSNHLGVILPGYRYSADMPPLHFTRRVLLDQGADTLSVDYTYYRTDFMQQSESNQGQWLSADIFAACNAVLARHPYEKITLVGKSIGTLAMGHLLADPRFQGSACIWFTPLLTVDWLLSRIEQIHPSSLFIIGTRDQFYQPDILKQLENATNGQTLVIEEATHALEIPDSLQESLAALSQMTQTVREFLNKNESSDKRSL